MPASTQAITSSARNASANGSQAADVPFMRGLLAP